MANQTMRSPLLWSIGIVGLIVGGAIALAYWNQRQLISEPPEMPLTAEAAPAPFIPTATDPWERAKEFGWEAAVATQTAATEAQWRRVGDLWLQAIAELEQVPPDAGRQGEVRPKIQEYLANFEYAESEKAKARANRPAASPSSLGVTAEAVQSTLTSAPLKMTFAGPTLEAGTPVVVGQSEDGLVTVRLMGSGVGAEADLQQMSLHLGAAAGAEQPLSMVNMVYVNHFLTTLSNGDSQSRWVASHLKQLQTDGTPVSNAWGRHRVTFRVDDPTGGVVVLVTPDNP